jgi:hypothetical protein
VAHNNATLSGVGGYLAEAPKAAAAGAQAENQLPVALGIEHDGPHGSVSAATYPQPTRRAIGSGA